MKESGSISIPASEAICRMLQRYRSGMPRTRQFEMTLPFERPRRCASSFCAPRPAHRASSSDTSVCSESFMQRKMSHYVSFFKCKMSHDVTCPIIHSRRMAKLSKSDQFLVDVARRLFVTRTALGLSQDDLAESIGCGGSAYRNWEGMRHGIKGTRAKRAPDISVMVRMCERWGVTLDWVYRGVKSSIPQQLFDKINVVEEELEASLEDTL